MGGGIDPLAAEDMHNVYGGSSQRFPSDEKAQGEVLILIGGVQVDCQSPPSYRWSAAAADL